MRCMLRSKGLPSYLWGEEISTYVYVLIRSPTKKLEGKTREEAWTWSKPSVDHLKIIGSICFKHVLNQLRRKLDNKGEQMILVLHIIPKSKVDLTCFKQTYPSTL